MRKGFYRFLYLPPNGTVEQAVLFDLDLYFQKSQLEFKSH